MALRPVSELGLVEITDVPARDGDRNGTSRESTHARRSPSQPRGNDSPNARKTATKGDRSRSAGASTPSKPDAGRRASQRVAGAAQPSTAAKSRGVGAAKPRERFQSPAADTSKLGNTAVATAEVPGRARGRLVADGVTGAAPRTASPRTSKRPDRSVSTRGRATAVRQTSAGSRANGNPASRATQRSRDIRGFGQTQPRPATKRSVSLLTGAGLVAGGVLVVRVLQR